MHEIIQIAVIEGDEHAFVRQGPAGVKSFQGLGGDALPAGPGHGLQLLAEGGRRQGHQPRGGADVVVHENGQGF